MAIEIPDGYELVKDDKYIIKDGDMFLGWYGGFLPVNDLIGATFSYARRNVTGFVIKKSKPRFKSPNPYPYGY
jgi:hypothetical protein